MKRTPEQPSILPDKNSAGRRTTERVFHYKDETHQGKVENFFFFFNGSERGM
jgi:hypothetical protein